MVLRFDMVLRKNMVLRFDIFYVQCFYIDIVIMVSIGDSTFNIRALLIFLIYIDISASIYV